MITKKVSIKGNDFLEVDLIPVIQKNQQFYISKIPAEYLLDIFTVRPAEYDLATFVELAKQFPDDQEYFNYRIRRDKEQIQNSGFQRKYTESRGTEIAGYLNNESYAFFPNTIIATCDIIDTTMDKSWSLEADYFNSEHVSILVKNSEEVGNDISYKLFIPFHEDSILVIDGQHRLEGLKKSDSLVIQDYELLVSFILGFDRSVIAELFYTINYSQKSVNKSLLYQLSGEFSDELNEITFLHETVKLLNELENSPFYKRIKMLGTVQKSMDPTQRKIMTISQAFLIDALLNSISTYAFNSLYQPIFYYYYNTDKSLQIEVIRFIMKYFNAIKKLKPDEWNHPENNVLSKTIGIGAFLKVMYLFFVKLFIDEFKYSPDRIKDVKIDDLMDKLNGFETKELIQGGRFAGTGSGGGINNFMKELIESISYFGASSYDEFITDFRRDYLPNFKDWLKGNTKI